MHIIKLIWSYDAIYWHMLTVGIRNVSANKEFHIGKIVMNIMITDMLIKLMIAEVVISYNF